MYFLKQYSNIVIMWCAGAIMWLLGGIDMALQVLMFMLITDYITGVMAAYVEGGLSSKHGYKGIMKKIGIIIAVMVAVMGDKLLGVDNTLRIAIILCFCGNEGISILENISRLGVPIPKKLIDVLMQLKGDDKK